MISCLKNHYALYMELFSLPLESDFLRICHGLIPEKKKIHSSFQETGMDFLYGVIAFYFNLLILLIE